VAAAALPAVAMASPAAGDLIIDLPASWCRRWMSCPGVIDGAPAMRVGDLIRTSFANEVSRVWLRVTEEDHADFAGYWLPDGKGRDG
jgi:hypothetical protein